MSLRILKKNTETEGNLKKNETENWVPPAGKQGRHLVSMGKASMALQFPPCSSLPAAPQALPGVFKSLLSQPSSFHLCLVEGRFLLFLHSRPHRCQPLQISWQLGWCPWEGTGAVPGAGGCSASCGRAPDEKELSLLHLHSPSSMLERIPDSEGPKGYSAEKTVGSGYIGVILELKPGGTCLCFGFLEWFF